jgi:hypothetical protein
MIFDFSSNTIAAHQDGTLAWKVKAKVKKRHSQSHASVRAEHVFENSIFLVCHACAPMMSGNAANFKVAGPCERGASSATPEPSQCIRS